MLTILGIAARVVLFGFGYFKARNYVQNKLRYVDAVHKPSAPLLAGVIAAVVAMPLTLLPIMHISMMTPVVFGAAVAVGVVNGARDVRRRIGAG